MSNANQDQADKSHDPTPQKLKKAREKGEIPKSADLSVAAGYAGLVLASLTIGAQSLHSLGAGLMVLLDQPDRISTLIFSGYGQAPAGQIMFGLLRTLAPWFTIPAITVLLSVIAQRGFVFTPSKLHVKYSRISILKNAANKFGRSGLFEFFKSASKLTIYSISLGIYINVKLPVIIETAATNSGFAVARLGRLSLEFLLIVLFISTALGVLDSLWQHMEHIRKNRMSRKEITDESKEAEGDPQIKQQRRQRAQQFATNQMMSKVPDSDVVIVNPTHISVCLKWSRTPGSAPVCVAKGADEIAASIRRAAALSGVPIHHDPPTARALHATTELGQEIPREYYRAVAASIRFAQQMRKRAKGAVS